MDWVIIGQQLVNGLVLGAIYGLIATGYTMVYGIIGMINFAHGEIFMISAYLTAIFLALTHWMGIDNLIVSLSVTFVLTVLFTGCWGWALERFAYRPLRGSSRLSALISAIGMSLVLQNMVRLTQSARTQGIPSLLTGEIQIGTALQHVDVSTLQCLILGMALVMLFGLTRLVHGTGLGRAMRAMEQDMTMGTLLGINPNRIIPGVFILGAMMAAIAGFLVTLHYGSFNFFSGFILGIKAFTAAVLGGIGSLPGAMLGGLILGLSESLFAGFIDVDYKDVFAFGCLILILVFRPQGLLGEPEVEKV